MERKAVSGIMLTLLLLISMLMLAFNIQPVKASGTIYIRADGSIDPTTAPITTVDNVTYTLTDNITSDADGIVIQRNNITLDGAGYTIQGVGSGKGIDLTGRINVTVQNMKIQTFSFGIYLSGWPGLPVVCLNNNISGNNITNSQYGVYLLYASNTVLRNNKMVNNTYNLLVFGRAWVIQEYVHDIDTSNTVDGRPVYYWVNKQDMTVPLDAGFVGLVNCTSITVQNLTLTKNSQGILLYLTSNTTINRNNITNNRYGIYLYSSNNNSVSGNNITANNWDGIYLYSSSNNSISGNNITNNRYGIYLIGSSNSTISGNNLTSNTEGIILQASSNTVLRSNNMTNNLYNLDVVGEFFNDIDTSNTVDGKPVYYWVNKQDMTVPADAGYVGLVNCTRITVQNLSLTKNGQGLLLALTSNTTITRNNITNNYAGIVGYNSAPLGSLGNNIFENMIANNSGAGVAFGWYSYNNIFSENDIINNSGVGIAGGYLATILGNNIKNNYIGIDVGSSSVISGNNVTENSYIGVTLGYTTYGSTVSGNNITNNGPLSYSTFWFPVAAGIDVYGASYNVISGNNIENNLGKGIWLHDRSRNNVISGNYIANNSYRQMVSDPRSGGIGVGWGGGGGDPCPNNVISGNNITNHRWYGSGLGIFLASSSNNSVVGNSITNNDAGVLVVDTNSRISGNNITNNEVGIHLWGATNNIIFENNVTNNQKGITTTSSSNNKIYHNTFMNNPSQAAALGSTDVWDDGYPSGGNYWSDYTGVDLHSGPYQNETGSDGIGDTPYVIDASNRDRYPLMKPYPWDPHDIGITYLNTSKTGCLPLPTVGQGYNVSINIILLNYGSYTETFNITVYANTAILATFTSVTLTSRNSTTITFTWNTSGFVKGNYTISAYATQVPGETETADNTYIDGYVIVAMIGDIFPDGIVDIFDLVAVGTPFGAQRGQPAYNPNADVNGDGIIDIFDLVAVGTRFGQTDP